MKKISSNFENSLSVSSLSTSSLSATAPTDSHSNTYSNTFASASRSSLSSYTEDISSYTPSRSMSSKFSSSVTNISDCSNFTLIEANKNDAQMGLEETGWKMRETIIKPSLKSHLTKGSCPTRTISTSSSSSFSSTLSDESVKLKPFQKKNLKSVALSYYHHLFNVKQKKQNSKKNNNLQPLYNKTLVKNEETLMPINAFHSEIQPLKAYRNEFNRKSTNSLKLKNRNNQCERFGSSSTVSSNSSTTSDSESYEIKQVKFRNYGLHKSIGESINKLTNNDNYVDNYKLEDYLLCENNNEPLNSSIRHNRSARSTNNLNSNVTDFYKSLLEENFELRPQSRNVLCRKPSHKSCSPPRRRSQIEHKYANSSLLHRVMKNFGKVDKNEESSNPISLFQGIFNRLLILNGKILYQKLKIYIF